MIDVVVYPKTNELGHWYPHTPILWNSKNAL